MAISHVCWTCGWDLARARARKDPHYGLPLVSCPRCHTASVRRRHPLSRGWRSTRRVGASLLALAFQSAVLAGLAAAATGACVIWSDVLAEGGLDLVQYAWTTVLVPPLVGLWLTAGLAHWRRPAAWACFAGLVLLALTVAHSAPVFFDASEVEPAGLFIIRILVLAALMTAALVGIPLGRLALAVHGGVRRQRRQAMRRRWRARRTSA